MKDKSNRSFWGKVSWLYDMFMKKDKSAYDEMYSLLRQRINPGMKVLELAAGTGLISLAIADKAGHIEATDFSPQMIEEAKKKKVPENISFSVQDACNLNYEDNSFDAVIISNALHIMPEPEKALISIKHVLKADGVLIAPTFTHAGNSFTGNVKAHFMELFGFVTYHKWTAEEYYLFLEDNGFLIEKKQILKASFPLTYVEARKL